MTTAKIIGAYSSVDFPELGLIGAVAKIDTGAQSGALHATHIREEVRDGSTSLVFYPQGDKDNPAVVKKYYQKRVRSSNGQVEKRYIIQTEIVIDGQTYPIAISLTDRSQMRRAILIGRRFLREQHFLVDVRRRAKYGSHSRKRSL